jgi:hypothetical protein
MLSAGLVNFISTAKTAKTSFEVLSVDEAESEHVECDYKVLEKYWDVC